MGHLDQPLNTFWQLFFRPRGGRFWSDQAAALAVATNGGLVLVRRGAGSSIGIRAVNKLDYSPLIVTSDARSWSPAGPIGALADEPDALAISAGGEAMALLGQHEGRAGARESGTTGELAADSHRERAGKLGGRPHVWPRLANGCRLPGRAGAHRGKLSSRRHRRGFTGRTQASGASSGRASRHR